MVSGDYNNNNNLLKYSYMFSSIPYPIQTLFKQIYYIGDVPWIDSF